MELVFNNGRSSSRSVKITISPVMMEPPKEVPEKGRLVVLISPWIAASTVLCRSSHRYSIRVASLPSLSKWGYCARSVKSAPII